MKSFTFTTLAALLLSAAQAEAIQSESAAAIDMVAAAELEHKHVSIRSMQNRLQAENPMNAIIQRNDAICSIFNNFYSLSDKIEGLMLSIYNHKATKLLSNVLGQKPINIIKISAESKISGK